MIELQNPVKTLQPRGPKVGSKRQCKYLDKVNELNETFLTEEYLSLHHESDPKFVKFALNKKESINKILKEIQTYETEGKT